MFPIRSGRFAALAAALALCLVVPAAALGPSGYRLTQEIPVAGDGGWDYLTVDAAARCVYVSRSEEVAVLDADSGKPVGEIRGLSGVHGIALAPSLGRGFISNGRSSKITIFDLKTLAVVAEVPSTGDNPDAILFDPFSSRVFAFNGRSGTATALEAASGKVAGTIALGGKPEFAVSDLAGRVYVNLEDKGEILALDPKSLAVEARWPLAPCEEPTGLAIDRAHHRLIAGCGNKLAAVLDVTSGKLVATPPIGQGVDATAFDAEAGLAFASNGEGTLTVLKEETPDKWSVLDTVATRRGARTMALDEKTHRIFLSTAKFGAAPAPSKGQPHPRPPILPGSFVVLVLER